MRRVQFLPTLVLMAALLLTGLSATHPQASDEECRYFPETDRYVCGAFLEFYETRGEIEIFGYPLTPAFDDVTRGRQVQYFQRARMEWHPENPAPYKVQLGLLVDELGYRFPAARREKIPPFNSTLQHYFPETGHVVSYAFLDYFREKGGVDIFGYPRSEFMYEDGYVVQYFQRARMEWHPEDSAGPRMRLTNLGELYLERFGLPENYETLSPRPGDTVPTPKPTVTAVRASASVRHVITGREGDQTVFVYVTDQRGKPVESASASMVIHYHSGDQRYEFGPTDIKGFTSRSFAIRRASPGQKVVVDVEVSYNQLTGTTQTFFIPWW